MKDKILTLVVDDEERIRSYLQETLQRTGHKVVMASNGDQALEILRDTRFDLAFVDLKLGGRVDGHRILEAIRWRWPGTAVVILTAHGTLESALAAIEQGVDGYLLKPVEPREVRQAARDALERRRALASSHDDKSVLEKGPFSIDLERHMATVAGQVLDLTPQEFDLLIHLMRNAPKVIEPPELVQKVRDFKPDTLYEARQIIKWYIHRLRHKVEPDPSNPRYILNVRGVGYRFADEDSR
jgi:DNA-binding response OmpR family regulator